MTDQNPQDFNDFLSNMANNSDLNGLLSNLTNAMQSQQQEDNNDSKKKNNNHDEEEEDDDEDDDFDDLLYNLLTNENEEPFPNILSRIEKNLETISNTFQKQTTLLEKICDNLVNK